MSRVYVKIRFTLRRQAGHFPERGRTGIPTGRALQLLFSLPSPVLEGQGPFQQGPKPKLSQADRRGNPKNLEPEKQRHPWKLSRPEKVGPQASNGEARRSGGGLGPLPMRCLTGGQRLRKRVQKEHRKWSGAEETSVHTSPRKSRLPVAPGPARRETPSGPGRPCAKHADVT